MRRPFRSSSPAPCSRRGAARARLVAASTLLAILATASVVEAAPRRFPDILVVTVDTLRYDRLSINGYARPLTPNLDRLLASGARFDQTRVVEPLTAPSLISTFTSLHPHSHAASRNGLHMRPGLPSVTRTLSERGYRTAAFVGNWTMKNELTGFAEHFDRYEEVFSRKRWFLWLAEATGADLNDEALEWLDGHLEEEQRWPFLLWVHYVEPHAPYRLQEDFVGVLGDLENPGPADRYDTEVAYVDHQIGRLLEEVRERVSSENLVVVFASDHGESLGEHGYWGHGRNLHEENLRVPFAITWPGRVEPRRIAAPASNIDTAPTLLGLLGLPVPDYFRGHDWSPTLLEGSDPPAGRITFHQAHKGAVQAQRRSEAARRRGLLEVGQFDGRQKDILDVKDGSRRRFDFARDPHELRNLAAGGEAAGEALAAWLEEVKEGLAASDELPPPSLTEEDLEQLRALGYIQ